MASIFRNNNVIRGQHVEIAAKEGYQGQTGASMIVIESIQNHMVLFEALVGNDVDEINMLRENATASELSVVYEAAGVGFIDKVKEFLKGVWAKIKGLFESFIANLKNVIIRDNGKFVKEYKDAVLKKDLSKMKYKVAVYKGSDWLNVTKTDIDSTKWDSHTKLTEEQIDNKRSEVSSQDYIEKQYGKVMGESSVAPSEFLSEVMKKAFDDEEEREGLDSSTLLGIMEMLTSAKKGIDGLEKAKADSEKQIQKALSDLDKMRSKVAKLVPKGGSVEADGEKTEMTASEAAVVTKAVSLSYDEVRLMSNIFTAASNAEIAIVKKHVSESRRVFARAAAYNDKAVKENTQEFMNAIDDESDFVMEMAFEGTFAY